MSEKLQGGLVAGSVDLSIPVILRSTTDNTEATGKAFGDVTASYWRQGGIRINIPAITLAAVNSAHADGGFKEVDSTNMPGNYRFDLPDAAQATGADWVVISIKVAGCYVFFQLFYLTGETATLLNRVLDATEIRRAAVNDAAASTTKFISNLTETDNDFWNRGAILFTSGNNSGQMRRIKDYNGSTKEITVQTILNAAPANADTFVIVAERAFLTVDIPDIADAVLDELTAEHVGAGSLAKAVSDILVDTNDLQTNQGNWTTATGFSTHDAAAVKTAIEAAGSKITLIKTQTDLVTAARMGTLTDWIDGGRLDLLIDAIKAKSDNLPSGIAKNVALSAFSFYMVLSSDHVTAATGKTLTGTISKDGGAFTGLTNAIAEISNGMYKVDITQAEMNADAVTLKFVETDCDQRIVVIYTT